MELDIKFVGNIQPNNKAEILKYIQKYKWLVPKWVHHIDIGLWDANGDTLASMRANYAYRYIELDIYSSWLDRTEKVKEKAIIHELLHSHLALMADFSRNTFDNLCSKDEAPKFNQHLQEQLTIYHESITEDLAYAILNKNKE